MSKSLSTKYTNRVRIEKQINSTKTIEYAFAENNSELYQIYKHLASKYNDEKNYKHDHQLPNTSSGSKKLQEIAWKSAVENSQCIDQGALDFIDYVWQESVGDLEDLFGCTLNDKNLSKLNLTVETVCRIFKKPFKNSCFMFLWFI